MFLLLIVSKLVGLIERMSGYVWYRNPLGWHIDIYIERDVVKHWELTIKHLFELPLGENASHQDWDFSTLCLQWLSKYAADDKNNRDEDNVQVVQKLQSLGFLNPEGQMDEKVRTVISDVIRLSHRGISLHFRVLKAT